MHVTDLAVEISLTKVSDGNYEVAAYVESVQVKHDSQADFRLCRTLELVVAYVCGDDYQRGRDTGTR